MNLRATIEYVEYEKDGETVLEAVVDIYKQGKTEKEDKWLVTERISLKETLPDHVIQIGKRYGDKCALHALGLERCHKKAEYYKGQLLSYKEVN